MLKFNVLTTFREFFSLVFLCRRLSRTLKALNTYMSTLPTNEPTTPTAKALAERTFALSECSVVLNVCYSQCIQAIISSLCLTRGSLSGTTGLLAVSANCSKRILVIIQGAEADMVRFAFKVCVNDTSARSSQPPVGLSTEGDTPRAFKLV